MFVNKPNVVYICCLREKSIFKYYIMIQINKKMMGGVLYVTPSVDVMDIHSEGVLCGSGDLTIKDWERDNESLEF